MPIKYTPEQRLQLNADLTYHYTGFGDVSETISITWDDVDDDIFSTTKFSFDQETYRLEGRLNGKTTRAHSEIIKKLTAENGAGGWKHHGGEHALDFRRSAFSQNPIGPKPNKNPKAERIQPGVWFYWPDGTYHVSIDYDPGALSGGLGFDPQGRPTADSSTRLVWVLDNKADAIKLSEAIWETRCRVMQVYYDGDHDEQLHHRHLKLVQACFETAKKVLS